MVLMIHHYKLGLPVSLLGGPSSILYGVANVNGRVSGSDVSSVTYLLKWTDGDLTTPNPSI